MTSQNATFQKFGVWCYFYRHFSVHFLSPFWEIAANFLLQSWLVWSEIFPVLFRISIFSSLRSVNGTRRSNPAILSVFSNFRMLRQMIYKPNKRFWRHFWVVISAMAEQNTSSSHGTQKWNAKFQNLEHFVSGPIHPFYGPVKCNRQFQIQTCVGTCLMAVWNIIYFRGTSKWNAHSNFGKLPFRVGFQHF